MSLAQGHLREGHQITWRMLPEGEARVIEDIRDALVIRDDELFLLTDADGKVSADNRSGFGLYHDDMRYLSVWNLEILGIDPVVLISTAALGYGQEQVMTNPELRNDDGEVLPSGSLEIRRQRVVDKALFETLRVTNYSSVPLRLSFQFEFDADFADLFELRGIHREERGRILKPRVHRDRVTLSYQGLDGASRRVQVGFTPLPDELSDAQAVFHLQIDPQRTREVVAVVVVDQPGGLGTGSARQSRVDKAAQYQSWFESSTRVTTSNDLFNLALERALADLRVLWTERDGLGYPVAGVPWFNALFGRDSALTAMMSLAFRPEIGREVLRTLASHQGTEIAARREEEPGKIVHEVRFCETANRGEVVFGRYFGSIDSTPLFLLLAAEYFRWTGDLALMQELREPMLAALDWLRDFADSDGDGFADYLKKGAGGLDNQGWKDSWDGVLDQDGRILRAPIALVEVQGYIYAAKNGVAKVFECLGDMERGAQLRREADRLRRRINEAFWVREGFFGLALEANGNLSRAVTSNAGQLLWSGAPFRGRARQQIDRLMQRDMYSGWGIRTLSSAAQGYNPLGYHRGTVWPHDNALIISGMKRYGAEKELNELATGLFDAAAAFPYLRLPELFSGAPRASQQSPVPYPVACRPQAFAAAALLQTTTAILGLAPDASANRLYLVKPRLPHWLESVRVSGLKVGEATVDLNYELRGSRTSIEVLNLDGDLDLVQVDAWPA